MARLHLSLRRRQYPMEMPNVMCSGRLMGVFSPFVWEHHVERRLNPWKMM